MKTARPKRLRCAVYTRKSSEEGLEQSFNSLDAQREACEAYIKSQAGEGWQLHHGRYDDGGLSGGTLERPALQQLLADIRARKVDAVVVYKVDRMTRSLADFAKIVEVFDDHGVSFVSVTQQFNTTTSMGRLTLNMLLSFAQFEREVTGERIRDKIAASKAKGMWMGGFVPLGYEASERSLVINEAEAETVRRLFRLYLEHGSVRRVKEEADRLGLTTKHRPNSNGKMRGGRPLSRGALYKLLCNPLYIGKIAHKGVVHEGQHAAIIAAEIWDAVQAKLACNTHERRSGVRTTEPSLLAGKLFDEAGIPLTPSHATKAGRRYRYYVSKHLISGTVDESDAREGWRLPAREIERIVGDAIISLVADRSKLVNAAQDSGLAADRIPDLFRSASRWLGQVLDLVQRVELDRNEITIVIDLAPVIGESEVLVRHTVPAQLRRHGVEMRLVLDSPDNGSRTANPDPALINAVARAHRWFEDLVSGPAATLRDIAKAEGVSDRYVSRLLPLAFLAPDIVEVILAGSHPIDVTAEKLTKHTELPLCWAEQRASMHLTSDCARNQNRTV